jgi:hypothetical protein
MVKLYPPILSKMSIIALHKAAKSSEMTISYSPFGLVEEEGTVYTKAPPIVKGLKGLHLKSDAELKENQRRVKAGLLRAIDMSKAHRELGVAIVNIGGTLKKMPSKAAEMLMAGRRKALVVGKPVTASHRGYVGVRRGVVAYISPKRGEVL